MSGEKAKSDKDKDLMPEPVPGLPQQILLKKCSVSLLNTYNLINRRFYAKKRERQRQKRKYQKDRGSHDYVLKAKERLNDRYVVDSVIGRGSFGKVVKAFDEVAKENVAIKIVKNKTAFYNQAQIEIRILESLHSTGAGHENNIVRVKDSFCHRNHQCIVFELLSFNLYELLRDTGFYGVSLTLTRKFGKQLLKALAYTKSVSSGIIHCDLKPENILLRNPRHSAIKVIDFGSACFQDEKMYTYIQSRFYRSPEVLLGCSYSTSIDMWSLGCILVEMHTGRPIFNGSNEREQIAMQVATLGLPPASMLESGRKVSKFFKKERNGNWQLNLVLSEKEKTRVAKRSKCLGDVLGVYTHGPNGIRRSEPFGHTVRDYVRFEDLIRRMLDFDPSTRILPEEALQHKFFLAGVDVGVNTDISIAPSVEMPMVDDSDDVLDNNDNNSSVYEEVDTYQPTCNSAPPLDRAQVYMDSMAPIMSQNPRPPVHSDVAMVSTSSQATATESMISV